MRVLVTGGAGFIGSHLVEALHRDGCHVRVLDAFEPQVHGTASRNLQSLLTASGEPVPGLELIRGDVRDAGMVEAALEGADVVVHLAAQVGVGQSMYEIARYVEHNVQGTAVLLQAVAARKPALRKLVVASSMAIYGEGAATCPTCGEVRPAPRDLAHPTAAGWEPPCPGCASATEPRPTPETTSLSPTSIYAITKRDQEEMCLAVGRAYGLPVVALRLFNVYGPRQALSNPYTGVAAIFSSRLRNERPPIVFEDGGQTRDFVHVTDVVQAIRLAIESERANFEVFNVGTGRPTTVLGLARLLAARLGPDVPIRVDGTHREGDVRHCWADVQKIARGLGYSARVPLEAGVEDLISWAEEQEPGDHFDLAAAELARRGLVGPGRA